MTIRFYDNNLIQGETPLSPPSEDANYPFENATDNQQRFRYWESKGHTTYVDYDLGYQARPTLLAAFGLKDEIFDLDSSSIVKLQANNIDDFTNPHYDETLEITDEGIIHTIGDDITGYRYWRISFDNSFKGSVFKIGYLYLGDHITVSNTNLQKGFNANVRDNSKRVYSENGNMFTDVKPRFHQFSGLTIPYIKANERRVLQQFFYDKGLDTPFIVSFDPELEVSEDLHEYTKLVVFERVPTFVHVKTDTYSMALNLREFI